MEITFEAIITFLRQQMKEAPLAATQKKISLPRIQRYCKMLAAGSKAPPIKAANDMIIEGHHRYISGLICGQLPGSTPWLAPHNLEKIPWADVTPDEADW
ncbi:MAG: hypothetical protein H7257_08435 [Taibaiella sp.]|nr:hypothetical protein [Taibaiella sp.]